VNSGEEDQDVTAKWLDGKAILVTGGTGSFGRRFIETVIRDFNIARLLVFSRDVAKQEEMRTMFHLTDTRFRYFIGDILDRDRIYRALSGIVAPMSASATGPSNSMSVIRPLQSRETPMDPFLPSVRRAR
jgi:FlaA1/EpsC-like NDP-sugar epimerase